MIGKETTQATSLEASSTEQHQRALGSSSLSLLATAKVLCVYEGRIILPAVLCQRAAPPTQHGGL